MMKIDVIRQTLNDMKNLMMNGVPHEENFLYVKSLNRIDRAP